MYRIEDPLTNPADLRATLGEEFASQTHKVIDHIDVHCRAWIERSPFVVLATADAAGNMDVSPKGDPLDDLERRMANNESDRLY